MFDFRYHVVSLAAVFLALIIGILVGAGISGRGLLDEAERRRLQEQIARAEGELAAERRRTSAQAAAQELAEEAQDAVLDRRLEGKRIAMVFVGSVDDELRADVEETIAAADGELARLRALTVPLAVERLQAALATRREFAGYAGEEHLADLGRDLGRELVDGEQTPLWDGLSSALVEEQSGDSGDAVDAIVVARTAAPQTAATAHFLRGLYDGLRDSATAVVGVESSIADSSAIPAYRRHALSSVDSVDLPVGRVALAVVLAGGPPGHYGIKETRSAVVPPIEPVPPPE